MRYALLCVEAKYESSPKVVLVGNGDRLVPRLSALTSRGTSMLNILEYLPVRSFVGADRAHPHMRKSLALCTPGPQARGAQKTWSAERQKRRGFVHTPTRFAGERSSRGAGTAPSHCPA